MDKLIQKLPENDVLKQMTADDSSAKHISDRITEIVTNALQSEQEQNIRKLATELYESQQLVSQLSGELSDTQKKAKTYRTKLKQIETEFAEQKAIYRKTRADAQRYSERLHEVNQTYQTSQNEVSNFKKMHDDVLSELHSIQQELNEHKSHNEKLLEENDQLRGRLEESMQLLRKSDKERLELRDMYLNVNEKIEDLVRMKGVDKRSKNKNSDKRRKGYTENSDAVSEITDSTQDDATSRDDEDEYHQASSGENIYTLKRKIIDLHKKLENESSGKKELKAKFKQIQTTFKEKVEELETAHHIIRKCQHKLEKYRKRLQDVSSREEKSEDLWKREKRELEEQLEREKRSFAELNREFQKKLDVRAEEYERQFKNSYENKILQLQREISTKETMLQKQNIQQILDAQLATARAHQQPEQMERMVQMLEQKIETYQRDYISKHQHELVIKELENRIKLEKKQVRNEVEFQYKQKITQLEQEKNREVNNSLSNIKQAVKSMEVSLDQEKQSSKKLAEKLESERKLNETLKLSLQGQDSDKKNLLQHLDDATQQINILRDDIDSRIRMCKQLQEDKEDLVERCNRLENDLDRISIEKRTLEDVLDSNKKELMSLKERLEIESRKNDESFQKYNSQYKDLSTMSDRLGSDREHLVNSIISVIRTVLGNPSAFSDRRRRGDISVEDVTEELQLSIVRMKKEFENELVKSRDQLEEWRSEARKSKWNRAQAYRKFELVLRDKLQILRKDLNQLKSVTEKEIIDTKHDVNGYMHQVSRRIEDITSNLTEDQERTLRRLDNEKSAIMDEYEAKLRMKQQELITAHNRQQEEKLQLDSKITDLEKQRDETSKAILSFQSKFEDLRRVLRVIDAYYPIPLDCQNRILSNERDSVNSGFGTLQQILDTVAKDKTRSEAEIQQLKRKTEQTQEVIQQLQQSRSLLEEEVNHLKDVNQSVIEEKKVQRNEYELQLISMKDQIGFLIEKQEELSIQKDEEKRRTILELREQYAKKLQQLHEKMGTTNAQMDDLRIQRRTVGGELQRISEELDRSLIDNE